MSKTKVPSLRSPLVSCLCITHKRPELLRNSIKCFLQQDYANKELVIVHHHKDFETIQLLQEFSSEQIKAFSLDTKGQKLSIGELRNIAMDFSKGDYLCTWDDDDWHGSDRIKNQLYAIIKYKKPASILTRVLMFDKSKQAAYLSHERIWEFSVFFEKNLVQTAGIKYRHINRAEDYYFVNDLITRNMLVPILEPTLYIYHATGMNTCDQGHFDWLESHSELLSPYQTLIVKKAITGELDPAEAYKKMHGENFLQNLRYIPIPNNRL